jgi:hypothetical protein
MKVSIYILCLTLHISLLTQWTKQGEVDISYLGSFTQKKEQFKYATVRENGISNFLMIGSDAIKEVLQTNPHTYPFR